MEPHAEHSLPGRASWGVKNVNENQKFVGTGAYHKYSNLWAMKVVPPDQGYIFLNKSVSQPTILYLRASTLALVHYTIQTSATYCYVA